MFISCSRNDNKQLYYINKENKCGFIDSTGKEIIPPKYKMAFDFKEGIALVVTSFGKYSLGKYSTCKYGYINTYGEFIIPDTFKFRKYYEPMNSKSLYEILDVFNFSEGLAVYYDISKKKYGYINKKGKIVIEAQYIEANPFHDGLAVVRRNSTKNLFGCINKNGKFIIDDKYTGIRDFSNGYATASVIIVNTKNASTQVTAMIINTKGCIVGSPYSFTLIYPFSNGYALANEILSEKYFYINTKGEATNYIKNAKSFSENRAAIKFKNGWGYIDTTFNVVIPPIFENANNFSNGLAAVKKDGLWSYIDYSGNPLTSFKYDTCFAFEKNLGYVKLKSGQLEISAYINRNGEVIWQKEKIKKLE